MNDLEWQSARHQAAYLNKLAASARNDGTMDLELPQNLFGRFAEVAPERIPHEEPLVAEERWSEEAAEVELG